MTGNEFKTARKEQLKVSQSELAVIMRTPKRTIQDLEAGGDKPVKGVYAVCIELLIKHDRIVTQAIIETVQAAIERDHPHGIASEQSSED